PFEKLVEELQPERELSYHPLFQVMFALLNPQHEQLELNGLNVKRLKTGVKAARADLTLTLWEFSGALHGRIEYSTDLFTEPTTRRLLEHYARLLATMAAEPDRRPGESPMLSATEREQLLIEWNQTSQPYPQECVHQLFEAQVRRTPESIAVGCQSEQMTYEELNLRANQVARYLQKRGVGPGTLVGICMERSLEMMVGLLGVLKAGGGYLPLDPGYPSARLGYMLADAEVRVVLSQAELVERVRELGAWGWAAGEAEVISIDGEW